MYYPIGDIHGCYDGMRRLYDRIIAEIQNGDEVGTIVFLGDYIDRGPDTLKILDFLMGLEDTGNIKHLFIKGNHEEFMTYCRNRPGDHQTRDMWLYHGGQNTLDALEITMPEFYRGAVDEYIRWLEKLPIIAYDDDYVFVHAAIDKYQPLNAQPRDTCLWAFVKNEEEYKGYDRIVVHGHMMKKHGPIVDVDNCRIWMDTGMNLFNNPATVCLPEPYVPGVELRIIRA